MIKMMGLFRKFASTGTNVFARQGLRGNRFGRGFALALGGTMLLMNNFALICSDNDPEIISSSQKFSSTFE